MSQVILSELDWLKLDNLRLQAELERERGQNVALEHEHKFIQHQQELQKMVAELAQKYGAEGMKFDPTIKGWSKGE